MDSKREIIMAAGITTLIVGLGCAVGFLFGAKGLFIAGVWILIFGLVSIIMDG